MSWHTKENYDLSEHHPRRKPPNAGNHNMVAQIQPMVPELSVFSLNSNSPGSRKPLRTLNNLEKSVEDSLCRTIHSKCQIPCFSGCLNIFKSNIYLLFELKA